MLSDGTRLLYYYYCCCCCYYYLLYFLLILVLLLVLLFTIIILIMMIIVIIILLTLIMNIHVKATLIYFFPLTIANCLIWHFPSLWSIRLFLSSRDCQPLFVRLMIILISGFQFLLLPLHLACMYLACVPFGTKTTHVGNLSRPKYMLVTLPEHRSLEPKT